MKRLKLFIENIVDGIYYGYPICCVIRFALLFNHPQRLKRTLQKFIGFTKDGRCYNPCYFHRKPRPDKNHKNKLSIAEYLEIKDNLMRLGMSELEVLEWVLDEEA